MSFVLGHRTYRLDGLKMSRYFIGYNYKTRPGKAQKCDLPTIARFPV
jgi:hypothetical protein